MRIRLLNLARRTAAVLTIVLAIAALWAVGCGGGGSSLSGSPTTPSTRTTAGGVTVNIVGTSGNRAFSPNPVQAPTGASLVWKNATSEVHYIVMNDGTLIGDIAPRASLTKQLIGSGGNYHCTTHPTMVGSINGASAPADPTPAASGSGYDYN